MDYATRYLKTQIGPGKLDGKRGDSPACLTKWYEYIEHLRTDFREIQGLDQFSENLLKSFPYQLSQKEKSELATKFIQFCCEALMVFEQCILFSQRALKKKTDFNNRDEQAFRLFVREEFYHTKAFRHYLQQEPTMNFPKQSLILLSGHRLKNIFAWILRHEPLAIILPGAKSESFSLHFTHFLESQFDEKKMSLLDLHKYHSIDEAYHVNLDFHLINETLKSRGLMGRIHFIFFNLLMMFFIQFIVIIGYFNIAKSMSHVKSLGLDGLWGRSMFVLRFFVWTLWHFPPYKKTKRNLKKVYSQQELTTVRFLGLVSTI